MENSPKPGFQPSALMHLLKVWADLEWKSRKPKVLRIIQSLEFLSKVRLHESISRNNS